MQHLNSMYQSLNIETTATSPAIKAVASKKKVGASQCKIRKIKGADLLLQLCLLCSSLFKNAELQAILLMPQQQAKHLFKCFHPARQRAPNNPMQSRMVKAPQTKATIWPCWMSLWVWPLESTWRLESSKLLWHCPISGHLHRIVSARIRLHPTLIPSFARQKVVILRKEQLYCGATMQITSHKSICAHKDWELEDS